MSSERKKKVLSNASRKQSLFREEVQFNECVGWKVQFQSLEKLEWQEQDLLFEEVFDTCIVDGNGVSGENETDEKGIYESIMTYK